MLSSAKVCMDPEALLGLQSEQKERWRKGFRRRLREHLKKHKLSQHDLAQQLGITDSAVSQWFKRTTPTTPMIARIAKVTNDPDAFNWLLGADKAARHMPWLMGSYNVEAEVLEKLPDIIEHATRKGERTRSKGDEAEIKNLRQRVIDLEREKAELLARLDRVRAEVGDGGGSSKSRRRRP